MDWALFWTATGVITANFLGVWAIFDKRFGKMDATLKTHGERLARIEEKVIAVDNKIGILEHKVSALDARVNNLEAKVSHMDGMLGMIVSFLLGHKTGTEK